MNEAYLQGFITKCAEAGIDPEELLNKTAAPTALVRRAVSEMAERLPRAARQIDPGDVRRTTRGAGDFIDVPFTSTSWGRPVRETATSFFPGAPSEFPVPPRAARAAGVRPPLRSRARAATSFFPRPPSAFPIPPGAGGRARRGLFGRAMRMPAYAAAPLGIGAYAAGQKGLEAFEKGWKRSPREAAILARLEDVEDPNEAQALIEALDMERRYQYMTNMPQGGTYQDPLLREGGDVSAFF